MTLAANEYKAIFGDRLAPENWITVRNYSEVPVIVYLTDNTKEAVIENSVTIPKKTALKLAVPEDFGGVFKHNVMVVNQNPLDKARVTVMFSQDRSESDSSEMSSILK